jgi:hypothetical protein
VRFSEPAAGQTEISYDADAVVGGMVGGVGQRMLSSVSKRMAEEFFANVGTAMAAPAGAAQLPTAQPVGAAPGTGAVFTAPVRAGGVSSRDDFVKGIVVGAGLVVLGVVVGSVFGRRR